MSQEQRDAQLRGSLLLHAHRKADRDPDGWASGTLLMMAARDKDRKPFSAGDEDHASQLLADLVELQLLDEKAQQSAGIGTVTLSHRKFRVTDKGKELFWRRIDSILGVDL